MIIPAFDSARKQRHKRQLGLGDTFSALKDDDKDKIKSTSARTTLEGIYLFLEYLRQYHHFELEDHLVFCPSLFEHCFELGSAGQYGRRNGHGLVDLFVPPCLPTNNTASTLSLGVEKWNVRADLVQSLILSLQTFPSYKTRRTLDLAMDESTYSSVLPRSEIRVRHLHTQSVSHRTPTFRPYTQYDVSVWSFGGKS